MYAFEYDSYNRVIKVIDINLLTGEEKILNEYEQTRLQNIKDLDARKKEIYSKNPRLEEIEKELNLASISIAKSALLKTPNTENLENKIEELKKEREVLLKQIGKDISCLNLQYKCNNCKCRIRCI